MKDILRDENLWEKLYCDLWFPPVMASIPMAIAIIGLACKYG